MRIASAKGLSEEECQILARVGYRKAKEFLQSIGMAPKAKEAAAAPKASKGGGPGKAMKVVKITKPLKAMKAMKA